MPLDKHNLFYGLRKKMTDEQEYMVNSIIDKHVVFSNSEAGTGKTTMALAALYYLYETGKIDRVYYVFSPTSEGMMGFRPGTQQEKEADYADPILGAVAKLGLMPQKAMDEKHGFLQIKSHTFMRGQDHERIGVIIDEAQNFTKEELRKTLTRFHDNCHICVIGHTGQIDLKKTSQSGFEPYLNHFAPLEDRVAIAPLTKNFRGWISKHADSLDRKDTEVSQEKGGTDNVFSKKNGRDKTIAGGISPGVKSESVERNSDALYLESESGNKGDDCPELRNLQYEAWAVCSDTVDV